MLKYSVFDTQKDKYIVQEATAPEIKKMFKAPKLNVSNYEISGMAFRKRYVFTLIEEEFIRDNAAWVEDWCKEFDKWANKFKQIPAELLRQIPINKIIPLKDVDIL